MQRAWSEISTRDGVTVSHPLKSTSDSCVHFSFGKGYWVMGTKYWWFVFLAGVIFHEFKGLAPLGMLVRAAGLSA